MENIKRLGRHVIAEFSNCSNTSVLDNEFQLDSLAREAVVICGGEVISSQFHKFSPQGVTILVLMSESHIAIHSYPEYDYAAVDVFTCGEKANPNLAIEYLKKIICPQKISMREMERGY